MRAYRATPAAVAALAPALPVSRSLLERAQELLVGLHSRLPGVGNASEGGLTQVAVAGGARGAGAAALAKALAICAGTVGGAAACVATGVAPAPLGLGPQHKTGAKIERVSTRALEEPVAPGAFEPPPAPVTPAQPEPEREPRADPAPTAAEPAPESIEAGAVEYVPPPPQEPAPIPTTEAPASSGSAAGEFGP